MEASFLTQYMLPLMLAVIMFGMGLSLTRDDFTRLWKVPIPIIVGLVGQILLLPMLAFTIAIVLELSPEMAIGLMILAACPGGTTSNIISHVARANLALSVSLTAAATFICVFTTPWLIKFSVDYFSETGAEEFSLLSTTFGLIFITLVPVILGIWIREKYPNAAMRREVFFRRFSIVFLLGMIVAITVQEREALFSSATVAVSAVIGLNILATLMGAAMAWLTRLSPRDGVTLGIEVGIQNAAMAMLIAITFLEQPQYAITPSLYGLTMYLGGILMIIIAKRVIPKNT